MQVLQIVWLDAEHVWTYVNISAAEGIFQCLLWENSDNVVIVSVSFISDWV